MIDGAAGAEVRVPGGKEDLDAGLEKAELVGELASAEVLHREVPFAIRDGEAAMEFRSYYSGKTMIRATSPGLKEAAIEIATLGEPKYVAGKTPPVKQRPYERFTASQTGPALVTLGRENPTRASSEAAGHSGRLVNDGNPATFWQASASDTNAWVCVDLERIATIKTVTLSFPRDGNWRYRVDISEDGTSGWVVVADQSQGGNTGQVQTLTAASGARGRFLRVSFAGTPDSKPAALAEILAQGTLGGL